jgi:hypothetical protein
MWKFRGQERQAPEIGSQNDGGIDVEQACVLTSDV